MSSNLISVILPVYNAEMTIAEAIESILKQTYSDFEFIIINDGSIDKSEQIILSYTDSRIKYYSNDGNKGLIYTLNRGIELSSGKYIARMDADDISLSERFAEQVRVMEEYPDIIVCGTMIKGFGNKKAENFNFVSFETDEKIRFQMVLASPIAHPTAMIRKKVLIDNHIRYNSEYLHAEDYKLWVDLISLGNFYNVQKRLLLYRISISQISQKENFIQKENARKCRREYIASLVQNEEVRTNVQVGNIRLSTLLLLKKNDYMLSILLVFYMSLNHYGLKELFYFLFSLDWLKFATMETLAIFKRFIYGKNSVL